MSSIIKRINDLEDKVARIRPIAGEGIDTSETMLGTIISMDEDDDEYAQEDGAMFRVYLKEIDNTVYAICRNTMLDEPDDDQIEESSAGICMVNGRAFDVQASKAEAHTGTVCLKFTAPEEVELLPSQQQMADPQNYGSCVIVLVESFSLPPPTDSVIYHPLAQIREGDGGMLQVTQAYDGPGTLKITWHGPCFDLLRDQLSNGYYD